MSKTGFATTLSGALACVLVVGCEGGTPGDEAPDAAAGALY